MRWLHGRATFASASYHPGKATYSSGPTVSVAIAWYASADNASRTAAQRGQCSATALAAAAESYEDAHGDPEGALPNLTGFACSDGWAAVVFSQSAPPPGFSGDLLFKAGEAGWRFYGKTDSFDQNSFGISPAVWSDLEDKLLTGPSIKNLTF
jgi:hypothetical protein